MKAKRQSFSNGQYQSILLEFLQIEICISIESLEGFSGFYVSSTIN